MKRRDLALVRRLFALAAAGLFVITLAGDRSRAASVPATINGQDPLEVLELKVRPNVIVVLDSSGSMTSTPSGGANARSGDHPASKMYQAKQVLKQVVTDNQDKVSFMFGQYVQDPSRMNNPDAGRNRFQYTTKAMPSTELTVTRALGDDGTTNRGLQSWQVIYPEWGTLYFEEDAATDAICTAALTGLPRFYASGSTLATALQTAMNTATCTGSARANTYTVTYSTASGRFSFARGTTAVRSFRIRWDRGPSNIRNALAETSTNVSGFGTTTVNTDAPYTLLYRTTGTGSSDTLAVPFKDGMDTVWTISETVKGTPTTFYQLGASRPWNGEVINVDSTGAVCGMTFATAATRTNPPSFTVQAANASCAPTAGASAVFTFSGASHGSSNYCAGFSKKADLIPCDLQSPPAPLQITTMMPTLQNEILFNADGSILEYSDAPNDGGWAAVTYAAATTGGARAAGATPIGNSLIDIKAEFTNLWDTGPTGGPWGGIPAAQRAIKNHLNPKEKTIVLFVTDGNDTCPTRASTVNAETDLLALRSAYHAQQLYARLDANEPASSVQTYVIGYGGAFSGGEPTRLNWIAWGGSGLTVTDVTGTAEATRWNPAGCNITTSAPDNETCISNYLAPLRAQCTTCTDALVAPDASTLASQLQSIIDQGASDGDFNAQQSIAESVFEYVDQVAGMDARMPSERYRAIVPTRFVSSFSLPEFKGQLRAYQNDGSGNSVEKWSAGTKLTNLVVNGMSSCVNTPAGGLAGECTLNQLHGGGSLTTAKIPRRIYTTAENGVYTFTPASLIAGTANSRVSLWPDLSWLPSGTDYSGCAALPGGGTCSFDVAAGLPNNNPTSYPTNVEAGFCTSKTYDQCWFDALQKDFKACVGSIVPTACTSTNVNTKMRAARREARDMMMAFMAGAASVPAATGVKRTTAAVGSAPARSLLFKARSWVLADSELATAAVVTPPSLSEPAVFVPEYELMRDGPRTSTGNPDSAGTQIRQGFGLAQPDADGTTATGQIDGRPALKPVMTVIYAPANDMLHAFRAGPCYSPSTSPANCYGAAVSESGGEELWGFLPYDQLAALYLRAAHEPQGRANHVYTLARGVRFADVFVPSLDAQGRPTPMSAQTIGGVSSSQDDRLGQMNGVWRRILYIGRGIGGKYVTAIDVTAPGPYTATALNTIGPIPLWSRGNPDTDTGLSTGSNNGTVAERTAYAKMGETWSMPTVAFVNPTNSNAIYNTSRRPAGVNFAIFMGSGYGASGEGTTHYTLDALSGDVIAAVDVEPVAATYGLGRTRCSKDPATGKYVETSGCSVMDNALVANSVSFNRSAFQGLATKAFNINPHPWSFVSTRVYIGDLHGRLWKFLTDRPDVAIPAADLGANQPIGVAVSLMAQGSDPATTSPVIFATSGADRRASGPFRNFSFLDDGTDTDIAVTGTVTDDGVTAFAPVRKQFALTFSQGAPDTECGYPTEAVFRGTIQPTGAVECDGPLVGSKCEGTLLQRGFFGGTRLSLPNTRFAPATPLACSQGSYPCRSVFDSILYAVGARTGQAAYDMNASGDDAYRILRDSRIAAISIQADPDPGRGGSSFVADEGLMKGTPKPPPPPGVPPTATTASANVVFQREPGQPAPAVRYGTTVCQ